MDSHSSFKYAIHDVIKRSIMRCETTDHPFTYTLTIVPGVLTGLHKHQEHSGRVDDVLPRSINVGEKPLTLRGIKREGRIIR